MGVVLIMIWLKASVNMAGAFIMRIKECDEMGILSSLFRSRDKPTDRTAGSSYSFFLFRLVCTRSWKSGAEMAALPDGAG